MASSSSQYFSRHPEVDSDPRSIQLSLADIELALTTDTGVFSADRVDSGSRLLLQEAPWPTPEMGNILDIGCGYGPIALTLARRSPASTVWAVDVNERAVALCAANAEANGIDNVRPVVVDESGLPVAGDPAHQAELGLVMFDAIWSNPPIRIGKEALHALLLYWLDRLAPGGKAWLVVQKHLGADSLGAWLEGEGWSTTRLVSRAGYRLLEVAAR
ncbi:RsmC 16S RNA G1207 methylase RsmC [Acidimicrobiia bacterium]